MDIPSAVTCRQIGPDSLKDPNLFFQRARTELLAAVEKSQQWRDECSVTVARIWESVQDLNYQDASLSARVQEWQQSIRSALPKGEINNQLRLAKEYLKRLDNAQKRILNAWGLTPNELLKVGSFFPSNLSQTMWRGLAEISEIVTLEEAKTLLVQKMHDRLNAEDHGHGWREDRWLLPQDLKATKKDLEKKKVSRAAIKTSTPQDFDIPSITDSITENLEEQDHNAGDSLNFKHVTTRAKRRKRNHDPDRAFDGRLVASRSTTKTGLDANGHPDTRNQHAQRSPMKNAQGPLEAVRYSPSSANLAGMEPVPHSNSVQGPGAGDYMNAVRHHEREGMQYTDRVYIDVVSVDKAVENSTSSSEVRYTLRAQLVLC